MKIFTKTYEISDEEFELLIYISKKGNVEYRDTRYETLDEFILAQQSSEFLLTINSFMSRNVNGTYKIAKSLYNMGFLVDVEDTWNITLELSELGREAIEQLTSTQYVRSTILEKLI